MRKYNKDDSFITGTRGQKRPARAHVLTHSSLVPMFVGRPLVWRAGSLSSEVAQTSFAPVPQIPSEWAPHS